MAAFEMVILVILIKMRKTLKILNLKQDFFAKGFEYTSGDMPYYK